MSKNSTFLDELIDIENQELDELYFKLSKVTKPWEMTSIKSDIYHCLKRRELLVTQAYFENMTNLNIDKPIGSFTLEPMFRKVDGEWKAGGSLDV